VTCDIDHVEAAIRLFQPDIALAAFQAYGTEHRAKRGTVKRYIMGLLREAPGPLTTLRISNKWIENRGLRCDEQTYIVMRKRIGAALISLRNAGTLANAGKGPDGYRAWVVA